ncbi:hypothetical protein NKH77_11305 [Streptomyces sp. M19]
MWGVWLVTTAGVLSAINIPHTAYTATLAPALAALSAAGVVGMWRALREGAGRGSGAARGRRRRDRVDGPSRQGLHGLRSWLLPVVLVTAVAAVVSLACVAWSRTRGRTAPPTPRRAPTRADARRADIGTGGGRQADAAAARARRAAGGLRGDVRGTRRVVPVRAGREVRGLGLRRQRGSVRRRVRRRRRPRRRRHPGGQGAPAAAVRAPRRQRPGGNAPAAATAHPPVTASPAPPTPAPPTAVPAAEAAASALRDGRADRRAEEAAGVRREAQRQRQVHLLHGQLEHRRVLHPGQGPPRPALGGFSGEAESFTLTEYKKLVSDGQLRFALVNSGGQGGFGGGRGDSETSKISAWVQSACTKVDASAYGASTEDTNADSAASAAPVPEAAAEARRSTAAPRATPLPDPTGG